VLPHDRRRLRLVAVYGVFIAGLDTLALVLVYALINILTNQPLTGVAATVVDTLGLGGSTRYEAALILLVITSVLFVARSVLSVFGIWLTIGAGNNADTNLFERLLLGHARAPQIMRLERNSAETLRTLTSSVDQAILGVVSSSVSLLANVAVIVAVATGLVLSSPLVATVISIYFAVVALIWVRVARGSLARRGRQVQDQQEERYRLMLQGLAAAKELQLRGRAVHYAEGAVARTRRINAAMRLANVANWSLRYMLETTLVLGAVLVVAVASLTGGRASVLAAVGLVIAGAFRLLPSLQQALQLTNQVQFSSAAIDLVETELKTYGPYGDPDSLSDEPARPLRFDDELRLKEVTYRYPTREVPALQNVSMAVQRGESLGIVGPTGSGKSTLLDVILGMLEPDTGSVTIDGDPLTDHRTAWQLSIGYVAQDVYLIDDTLRANIALGWYGDEIDDDRVNESIRLAGLVEVVAALPDGASTVLGERGVRLSGGQRQRVGLARALYTRPSVLVLDEATSNLDQATEHRIVDTLAGLQGGVTMVVVTHRPASARYCDKLVYLEHGAVRAFGTVADVRAAVPEFDAPLHPLPVADAG
jgi:ATP-binding cassette, subfamily B, bacterial PglK